MKKENRKMAQERRAVLRKKQKTIRKIKKFLAYFIPSVAVLVLVIVLIVDSTQNARASEKAKQESVTESKEDTSEEVTNNTKPVLSTNTSLTIKDGDTVNIDYVGSIDGVEFEGGNTQGAGTDLVIGSHSYIDDFEEQLIGVHPGDQVDVNVTFPEDYGQENLNGKDALFKVTVNGIYK